MSSTASSVLSTPRHRLPTLVVAPGQLSSKLRKLLMSIGFDKIDASSSLGAGMEKCAEKTETKLVFFDASLSDTEMDTFVQNVKGQLGSCVMLAVAEKPDGDQLFSLLKEGVAAFIIPPFTSGTFEQAFVQAQMGAEIDKELFENDDRVGAFLKLTQERVDKVGQILSVRKDILSKPEALGQICDGVKNFVSMARFFTQKSSPSYDDRLADYFIEYAQEMDQAFEKSRLRRTREALKQKRSR